MRRLLGCLAAVASASVARAVGEGPGGDLVRRLTCPNPDYRLWSAKLYGPLYDKDPAIGTADVPALFGGKRMLEIGGPTPGTNIYDVLAGADNVAPPARRRRSRVRHARRVAAAGHAEEPRRLLQPVQLPPDGERRTQRQFLDGRERARQRSPRGPRAGRRTSRARRSTASPTRRAAGRSGA